MVFKVRVADSHEEDFIEVEVPVSEMTFQNVLEICCAELDVEIEHVS